MQNRRRVVRSMSRRAVRHVWPPQRCRGLHFVDKQKFSRADGVEKIAGVFGIAVHGGGFCVNGRHYKSETIFQLTIRTVAVLL